MATLTDAVASYRQGRESSIEGAIAKLLEATEALLRVFAIRPKNTPDGAWRKTYSNLVEDAYILCCHSPVTVKSPPVHDGRDWESFQRLRGWARDFLERVKQTRVPTRPVEERMDFSAPL